MPIFNVITASSNPVKDSPLWLCRSWTQIVLWRTLQTNAENKKAELVLVKLLYKMKDVTDKPHEYTYWSLADSHSHISLHTILKTRPSIWASDVQWELVLVKGAVMPCFRSYGSKQLHSWAKLVFIFQLKEITHWEFFIDVVSLQPSRFALSFVQSKYFAMLKFYSKLILHF